MLNFNPEGKKVILSIDGGGMRGTIAVAMLAELERMTGKPCQELFHMVGGTSTGAIIAAALALGLSAEEILNTIYKDRLHNAFPRKTFFFWLRYVLTGMRYLYPVEPFIEALVPFSSGFKVGDVKRLILLITTKDMVTGDMWYIVNKGPGRKAFEAWPLSGAVAASSAAPVYFPPVAQSLIDGGVGVYGNPSLSVAVEAMEYIGAAEGFVDNNVILFSLGTGYVPTTVEEGRADRYWLLDWIQYLIYEGMDEAALQQVFVTDAIYRSRMDFRRYNPYLTRSNVIEHLGVPLADDFDPMKLGLDSALAEDIAMMEQIGRAYASKIDWTVPHVMPWMTTGGHPKPTTRQTGVDWSKTPFR
jgi:uncharacterized protein